MSKSDWNSGDVRVRWIFGLEWRGTKSLDTGVGIVFVFMLYSAVPIVGGGRANKLLNTVRRTDDVFGRVLDEQAHPAPVESLPLMLLATKSNQRLFHPFDVVVANTRFRSS